MEEFFLDRPEILQFIFYPRREEGGQRPPNAIDCQVEVEEGVRIGCRFYIAGPNCPNLLFFHGNGEIAADYDYVAPYYNQKGINLFVADYRGYGQSTGSPTYSNMLRDAHGIWSRFRDILEERSFQGPLFVMGRSLGSASALELATHYGYQLRGMIIESGFASISRLFQHLGLPLVSTIGEDPRFSNLIKARSIDLPALIIHAEKDLLIPLREAQDLYDNLASSDKQLLVIPQADHNDIMVVGAERYFNSLAEFISRHL